VGLQGTSGEPGWDASEWNAGGFIRLEPAVIAEVAWLVPHFLGQSSDSGGTTTNGGSAG
jgi:hypothetical protein